MTVLPYPANAARSDCCNRRRKRSTPLFNVGFFLPHHPVAPDSAAGIGGEQSERCAPLKMATVQHILVAPERGAPMVSLTEVEALAGCGLRGDRYSQADHPISAHRQVTLIELENIQAFAKASGLPLVPHEPRRNIVTVGADLNSLCGRHFSVGAVEMEGLELCEPCGTFARRTHPEVVKFFVHKGGLRARIIKGGLIRVGDSIR